MKALRSSLLFLLVGPAACGAPATTTDAAVPDGDGIPPSCIRPDSQLRQFLDLNVAGRAFVGHDGRTVHLVARSSPTMVLGAASATVVAGGFDIHLEGGCQRNVSQQLLWFVDEDGDGLCNAASGDHIGYLALDPFDPVANDALAVTISDNHVSDIPGSPDPCSGSRPFADMADMNVMASGFDAHEGAIVHLLTRSAYNGASFGRGQATIAAGGFALQLPHAFVSFTYQEIFWFVDVDGDGACTTADHPGYTVASAARPTGNDPLDQPITDNHTAMSGRGADVCVVMNGCPVAP